MEKVRDVWVRGALIVSLLVPVYFVTAALGTKFGLIDWRLGFGQLTFMWGPRVLMGAGALALIGLLLALFVSPRRGIGAALLALLIPGLGIGYGVYVGQQARAIPPIHDISTDLVDPPSFSAAVVEARAAVPGGNDLDLLNKRTRDGATYVELQREAYSDITHVSTGLAPVQTFDAALALAQEQGWTIGHADRDAGIIEASATSFWYGFTDDIAIRVRAEGTGARVDVRSVSRVGQSDLGANAARMRPYLEALRAQFNTAS